MQGTVLYRWHGTPWTRLSPYLPLDTHLFYCQVIWQSTLFRYLIQIRCHQDPGNNYFLRWAPLWLYSLSWCLRLLSYIHVYNFNVRGVENPQQVKIEIAIPSSRYLRSGFKFAPSICQSSALTISICNLLSWAPVATHLDSIILMHSQQGTVEFKSIRQSRVTAYFRWHRQ
jgi:hypothetical protein